MSGKGSSNNSSYRVDTLTSKEKRPEGKGSTAFPLDFFLSGLLLEGAACSAENLPFAANHSRNYPQPYPEACVLVDYRSKQGDNQEDGNLSVGHGWVCQGTKTQSKQQRGSCLMAFQSEHV